MSESFTLYTPKRELEDFSRFFNQKSLQSGYGPRFSGLRYQQGRGLGAALGALIRRVAPVALKSAGKAALKAGASAALGEGEKVVRKMVRKQRGRGGRKGGRRRRGGKGGRKRGGRKTRQRGRGVGTRPMPRRVFPIKRRQTVSRKGKKRRAPLQKTALD